MAFINNPRFGRIALRYFIALLRDYRQFGTRQLKRDCNICGFHGIFVAVSRPPRWNARCPNCDSRERHRLAHILYSRMGLTSNKCLHILHFAPEKFVMEMMKDHPHYVTSDPKMEYAKLNEDIQSINFVDNSFDVIIAHQVLEHIPDDILAMREVFRVLKPGGQAILTVPQNWSRSETFESPEIKTRRERSAAYGAIDHVRMYGSDFSDRLRSVGFITDVFRLDPLQSMRNSLGLDEVIHIAKKPT